MLTLFVELDKVDEGRKSSRLGDTVTGWINGMVQKVRGTTPEPERPQVFTSPWELPEVDDEEIERAMAAFDAKSAAAGDQSGSVPVAGQKRKSSAEDEGRRQRARNDDDGEEYLMSGAL